MVAEFSAARIVPAYVLVRRYDFSSQFRYSIFTVDFFSISGQAHGLFTLLLSPGVFRNLFLVFFAVVNAREERGGTHSQPASAVAVSSKNRAPTSLCRTSSQDLHDHLRHLHSRYV